MDTKGLAAPVCGRPEARPTIPFYNHLDPTAGLWLAPGFCNCFLRLLVCKLLNESTKRAVTGHLLLTCHTPKTASDATLRLPFFSNRNRIPLIRNPIAPASYPPTNPYVRRVPTYKSRGSDRRGGNVSENMPAPMCSALPWLRLGGLVEQEAREGRGLSGNPI
jgi:hypothetical protein